MRFNTHWVRLISQCTRTISFQMQVNEELTESFQPKRGLRQGDPLSPYLFIICQNVLSCMIAKAEEAGWLKGVKISRNNVPINHMLFADDNYMFFEANVQKCKKVRNLLNRFCRISGMNINHSKYELLISPNCRKGKRRWF